MQNIEHTFTPAKAIKSLHPTAEWVLLGGIDLEWLSPDITQPTEAEIQAEIQRLQAEYDSQAYARERKRRYDSVNQLEMMSDDSINGTTTHKDFILKVKADVPKTWTKENT